MQAKKFESLGLSRQQAEEMTQYLAEQIILDRLRLSEKFSAKVELEKVGTCMLTHYIIVFDGTPAPVPMSALICSTVARCAPGVGGLARCSCTPMQRF